MIASGGGSGMVGALQVKVTADTSSLAAKLKADAQKAGAKFSNTFGASVANGLGAAGKNIEAVGASFSSAGAKLTKGLTLPIVGIGTAAVLAGASFEKSMNQVKAVSGATGDDFKALEDQAKELGRTTAFSASEAAEGMSFLAMAGFKTEDILKSMPGTLNLAAAGQMDLARAADISSNILTGFGMSAGQMDKTVDVLAQTFTNANTSLEQLGEAMKYAAPVASAVGLSFEESAAAIGLMGNAGIQGSMAGTSLRGALSRLIDPPTKAAKAIKRLGLETTNSDGSLKSMVEIVEELEKSGANTADMMAIFGMRAGPAMAALVSQGSDALADLTDKNLEAAGKAQEIAETQLEGTAGAFVKLKSAWEGAMIAISESGILEMVGDALTQITGYVQKFANWLDTLDPKTKQMATKFALIAAAAGPVLWIFGKLIGVIGKIVGGIGTLIGVVGKIFMVLKAGFALLAANPVVLIIAGIVAAIIGIVLAVKYAYENFEWFRNAVDAVWKFIQDAIAFVVDWFQTSVLPVIQTVVEGIVGFFQDFARVATDVWNTVYAAVETVVVWFQENVAPVISAVVGVLVQVFQTYVKVVQYVWGVVFRAIEVVVKWFSATVAPIIKRVVDLVVAYFQFYWSVVQFVWNAVQKAIEVVVDWFQNTAWPVIKKVIDFIVAAWNGYVKVVRTVWNAVMEVIKKVVGWIVDNVWPKIKPVVDLIVRGWQNVWTKTKETWDKIIGFLKGLIDQMLQIGGDIINGIKEGIGNAWGNLVGWFKDKINDLPSAVKYILGIHSPSRVFMKLGGNVVEGFGIGLETIGKVNDEFVQKLGAAAKASEKKIDGWVKTTKAQLDDAVKAWKDYRDQVFTAITGDVNFATAFGQSEDQAKAVREAQKALDEAMKKSAEPGASDSDHKAVVDAQAKLAEAQAAVKTFEQNLAQMLDESELFGTMFDKASTAMIDQFGADSPIWQMMNQQMLQMGPVEGAKLAQYIAENGLSPEMQDRLLNWNAWAGSVASDQADKNKGQGIKMAEDAMKGLNQKIKDERARLVRMGERMGDGVIVGFKDKESDFKRAVRGYINAAYAELGIRSPSRVFAKIGEYTADGFNMGVESNLEPFSPPPVSLNNPRVYAPGLTMGDAIKANVTTDVKVFLGDKELTDLVDVQIEQHDAHQMDLVIAGRRF
jgi:TP901 family phage tail tape measure protein